MENKKVRIRLRSYDAVLIDKSAKKIAETATVAGTKVVGPIPLPTEKEIFTVLKSRHINKDSREQFELRTHKRLIDLVDVSTKTIDQLSRLSLPSGVDIDIKN